MYGVRVEGASGHREKSWSARCAQPAGRSGDAGVTRNDAAVDKPEHDQTGAGIDQGRTSCLATYLCDLLAAEGYSLQSVRKTREGAQHPDRDAQFHHLNAQAQAAIQDGQPVISVDTKKKELVGDFKNAGQEWRKKRDPVKVRVHDFADPVLGKAAPYGVYDLAAN